MNTYYVELNFSGKQTIETGIAVSQGDYGQVQFSIAAKKDGEFITGALSAEIVFNLKNGYIVNGDLSGTNGLYTYTFQGNELQAAGRTVATVILHYADGRTSSESFAFTVRYNPLYDRGIDAGPYITQLERIQKQAQGYVDYLEILIDQLKADVGETALTKADLQNDFTQSQSGIKALDAALGPQILQKSNVVNNLLATVTGNVLDATQGKALDEKITQLYSKMESIITSSPTGGSALRVPSNGIGNCVIWSNSTEEANYGSVFGDYNDTLNTELLLHNGSLVLKITRADQTTEQKVIASIDS